MLRQNVNKVFFFVIVYLNIYLIISIPVFRRSELQDMEEIFEEFYRHKYISNSFRNKRNPTIGPDLGYGNRWHAGYSVAQLQSQIEKLTGVNSPGKRSMRMYEIDYK